MRIALAQINPLVGDVSGNHDLIGAAIDQSRRAGVELVIFPELAVIGYPPKDLLLKPAAIEQCRAAVQSLAAMCKGIAAIIGYPCPSDDPVGRSLYNAAAFCRDGQIVHRQVKSLLPTYDVFDERRYFQPAEDQHAHRPVDFAGHKLAVSICEDLWVDYELQGYRVYREDPIEPLMKAGADLIINCSASPFVLGKHDHRLQLLVTAAKKHRCPIVYCNQVGGNDELVFDGNSCVLDASGKLLAHARDFESDLLVVEVEPGGENTPGKITPHKTDMAALYHALVLGLRDYVNKCGFKSIVLGLSGGIDSALTAALCVAAIGGENVRGVAMPSRFSSQGSVDDARALAENLKIKFDVVPITGPHEAFESLLGPHFAHLPADTTEENIQARVRGVIMMAYSNKFGSLLVTTGNKSELAVGYCTLYGDMAGGLAVISDVPKMMVWQLARWINENPASPLREKFGKPVIPENSISKPPSAELRPDQTDQDSLPPYEILDRIVQMYVEEDQSVASIMAKLPQVDEATVRRFVRLIDINEYKRKQAAPGLKVTGRAFGFGRRMPIAQKFVSH